MSFGMGARNSRAVDNEELKMKNWGLRLEREENDIRAGAMA